MRKLAVYIGRFQPFHYGHKAIIDRLLKTDYHVLVLIGAHRDGELNERNPIPPHLVSRQIKSFYFDESQFEDSMSVSTRLLYDQQDNLSWIKRIDSSLLSFQNSLPVQHRFDEISLVIHNKPSEAGKYGLEPDQYISDYILKNSKVITTSINLNHFKTPRVDATRIRMYLQHLLKWAPKSSIYQALTYIKD